MPQGFSVRLLLTTAVLAAVAAAIFGSSSVALACGSGDRSQHAGVHRASKSVHDNSDANREARDNGKSDSSDDSDSSLRAQDGNSKSSSNGDGQAKDNGGKGGTGRDAWSSEGCQATEDGASADSGRACDSSNSLTGTSSSRPRIGSRSAGGSSGRNADADGGSLGSGSTVGRSPGGGAPRVGDTIRAAATSYGTPQSIRAATGTLGSARGSDYLSGTGDNVLASQPSAPSTGADVSLLEGMVLLTGGLALVAVSVRRRRTAR